jgi:uncharacterized repeat protein (TIGR03806 family)
LAVTLAAGCGTSGGGGAADSGGPPAIDAAPLLADAAFPAPDAPADRASDPTGQVEGPAMAACAPPRDVQAPVAKLSETGCVDPKDPRKLAGIVVPYEINSPLWSDGADKTRGMVIPAGQRIHVKDCAKDPADCPAGPADDGKWVFPVGTVMIKTFSFDDKLVETRLFVRSTAETWVGYSYQWDQAQTDATIVPDQRTEISFDTGKRAVAWTLPSRADCMRCHLQNAGSTLGPETAQLNRLFGGMNQLDRLQALGLFEAPLARPYRAALATPYPTQGLVPAPSATVEQRARAYLHANCAFCHRPDALNFAFYDLRHDVPLAQTGLCNAAAMKGDAGVPGALVLKPARPAESVLWLRMKALPTLGRMPPLASKIVDSDAMKVVGDWISSIAACPM